DGRVAALRLPVDGRSAGEPEAHHPGELVERLAGGVVDGGPQGLVLAPLADVHDLAVTPGGEQADGGQTKLLELEAGRHEMSLHVVDADERQPRRPGERLGEGVTDQEGADQAGTG